jgi:hypothetical protein
VPDQATVQCISDAVVPAQIPVVTDVCGTTLTPGGPVTGGTMNPCGGTVTYTWTWTDCAALTYHWVFTYTVDDQTPPVLTCPGPQQRTLPSGMSHYTTAGVEFDPTGVSDNCGVVAISNNLNGLTTLAGYAFAPGITTVIWTAEDLCGNTTQCTLSVEVVSLTFSGCLDIRAFLQGPFDPATGMMHDSLRTKGFIPLSEPYSAAPFVPHFAHAGGGGGEIITDPASVLTVTGPNAIVDWVFIELRDQNNSSLVLHTRAALIKRNGEIVATDGTSLLCFSGMPVDQYYVAVRHRNHLGVMTATPVQIIPAGTVVDFRFGQQPEFDFGTSHPNGVDYTGLAQKDVKINTRALFAGNANADNKIKYQGVGSDRTTILTQLLNYPANVFYEYNYGFAFGYYSGDTNMDGQLKYMGSGNDAVIMLSNLLNYTTGSTQSYDFMIEQLP